VPARDTDGRSALSGVAICPRRTTPSAWVSRERDTCMPGSPPGRYRSVHIRAGKHTIAAEDPLPPDPRDALAQIN
jgi:hypothetical protein